MSFPQTFYAASKALWQQLRHSPKHILAQLYQHLSRLSHGKRSFTDDAKILVFTTLLTLVPLLAVTFALLRGFGLSEVVEPWLRELFQPLGKEGELVVQHLLQFVAQADGQQLGAVGVVFLLFSVQTLRKQVTHALNRLWQVPQSALPLSSLIGTIGFIVVFPLLLAALMHGRDALHGYSPLLAEGLVLLGLWLSISALYYGLPQTKMRFAAALWGGAIFMLCWLPLSYGFTVFIRYSHSYSVLYSSFATVILLLLWLQSLWVLFLWGGQCAVWWQQPHTLLPSQSALRPEQQAYDLMAQLEHAFSTGQSALSAHDLSAASHIPLPLVLKRLAQLETHGLILQSHEQPPRYALAFAPQFYTLARIDQALYPESSSWWHAQNPQWYQISLTEYRQARMASLPIGGV